MEYIFIGVFVFAILMYIHSCYSKGKKQNNLLQDIIDLSNNKKTINMQQFEKLNTKFRYYFGTYLIFYLNSYECNEHLFTDNYRITLFNGYNIPNVLIKAIRQNKVIGNISKI